MNPGVKADKLLGIASDLRDLEMTKISEEENLDVLVVSDGLVQK